MQGQICASSNSSIATFYLTIFFQEETFSTLQKMTCYSDNCICYQNCNCDMILRDDARLVLVTAIYGVQQQLKFALNTKILAAIKTDWPL